MFSTIRTTLAKSISTKPKVARTPTDGSPHLTAAKFETPDFGPLSVKSDGGIVVNRKQYSQKTIEKYW